MAKPSIFEGDVFKTNQGYEVIVIGYENAHNITVQFNDTNKTRLKVESSQLRRGNLTNPFHPSVRGIGFFGVGPHLARKDSKRMETKYDAWSKMLTRCYDENYRHLARTYANCTVAKCWHNYQEFAEWYTRQVGCNSNYHLDKDLLFKGNKEYSPETCVLLPREINNFSIRRESKRGSLPIGVNFVSEGRYVAQGSFGDYSKKSLGYYPSVEEAFERYKEVKESYAKHLATVYRDRIDVRAVRALENFKVEWGGLMSKTAVVDADFIAYAVASAGEKRSVIVTHKPSGRQVEVGTRTEWHGDWRKRDGGVLAEINAKRTSPFDPDEFEFEDVQTPEPIENVLHSAKTMFTSTYKNAGAGSYIGFLGGSNNFRDDVATIWRYKGDRENLIKPLYLKDVRDYLSRKFNLEIVDGMEADDAVVIEAHGRRDRFVISPDKDTGGNHVMWYNPHKPEQGIVDCMKLGNLFLDGKGEVRGFGRMFFYYQCASGDRADCYAANSACGKRWGDKSAYKALVDCKTDKEALIALKEVYQKLYPEPLTITGWRGDQIEVDWKYVLNENWQLARMVRSADEIKNPILATDVMTKMEIEL